MGVRESRYEKVTRTDHPTCPRAKADVTVPENHSKSYLFAGSCPRGAERFISREDSWQNKVKANHSLAHTRMSVSIQLEASLLTMPFNKQFKECDDLVLNDKSCFLECKEYISSNFFLQCPHFSNSAPAGQQVAHSVMCAAGRSSHIDVTSHS